jgi:hypothetical protein
LRIEKLEPEPNQNGKPSNVATGKWRDAVEEREPTAQEDDRFTG